MSTVALPRWLLGTLVGLCAVCVLAVAFLLGRVSAPGPAAPPLRNADAGPQAADGGPDARLPSTELPAHSTGTRESGLEASGEGPAAAPATAADSPAGSGPEAAAVAAYFRQVDAIAAEAKVSQDPQALARSILDQAMSGNASAIEGLIATQRSLETRLGQVQPPPACHEHHQRSVRLFGRAITLLERTRDAMSGQGASDLASVATEGRAIEAEAKALDALANDLRRAAGLAPVP